uniref:C2H2-type domain-containing protein n=1 Tax=Plectus sambesii TaxID=2011161 RepID=A0A914VD26_9BILA
MRHGDDQNHATKIFGFRREYLDRVSEIVYKDCIDAQKRGIEAVMKCTVVRGTDDDSKRQRAAVSESSPTATNERRVTTSVPDSTADAVPMSPTKARTSKKSKKGLDNTPSSSSFNRSVKIEVEQSPPPAVCRKCKGKVAGGVDRLRRHAFEHLRNVSWRCSYCMFRTSDSFAKLIKHATRKHPGRKPLDICDCVEDDDAVEVMSRCFPDISRQTSGLAPVVVSSPITTEERSPPAVVQSSRVAASSFVERRVRRSSSPGRVVSQSTTSPSALADGMSTDGSSSNGTAAHKIFCNECGASVSSLYGAKRS